MARTSPAPRPSLSRERVLRAALALVDERGLDELSMRKLASELDVEAMSLYNHVKGKDDILAGILDLVASEIEQPGEDLGWKDALRARSIAAYEAFVRRPWAARIWMSASEVSISRFAQYDGVLRWLRESGLHPLLVYRAYHVLDGYVLGYALQHQEFSYTDRELQALAQDFLRDFPQDDYPDFAEHVRQHLDPAFTRGGGSFEFGLDLILDGLERLSERV
jgi:AcrR family transcriptional regulator